MYNYDFSTLNCTDFEEFVCDLLNAKEASENTGVIFKTFKEGKDKGIDFLYSEANSKYDIIGQAKHYLRSGYSALEQVLKNDEKDKVNNLKPRKYIFATSVDLSVANTESIQNIFKPHIKSLNDIYGQRDLNRYLEKFPNVLDSYFKLWFSSKNVLSKLLNYRIEGRSLEFEENEIKKRLRLFVKTNHFNKARTTLENYRLIIITGEPGVGKTTMAELLLYEYIKNDYKLTYIYDDIKEVELVLKNDESKQIFYYDDFLGHNEFEIIKAKSSETALMKILRRISHLKNKYFILTTRTFILNSAINESENLRRFNLKAKESTLALQEYSTLMKLQLLLNHNEESELSEEYKVVLNRKSVQDFIVYHKNFFPRSVEFITTKSNINKITSLNYEAFIRKNFNKPDEIWRHAYEHQINEVDRLLLNTMISFGDSVDLQDLEKAFIARLDYEAKYNNFKKPLHPFTNSTKRLMGGFIVYDYHQENNSKIVKFINPSLVDFLIGYLLNERDEVVRISESAFFLDQLITRLYVLFESNTVHPLTPIIEERLLNTKSGFVKSNTPNSDNLIIAFILYKHLYKPDKIKHVILKLSEVSNWQFLIDDEYLVYQLHKFINAISEPEIIEFISSKAKEIFIPIILQLDELDELIDFLNIIKSKFGTKIKEDIDIKEKVILNEHISMTFNEKIISETDWLKDVTYDEFFVEEKHREFIELRKEYEKAFGFNIEADFSPFFDFDWNEIGNENYIREQMSKDN